MKYVLVILLFCVPVMAQRPTAGRLMSGTGVPVGDGSGNPTGTCNPGPPRTDVYVRTDTNPHKFYMCSAVPRLWTELIGGGSAGGTVLGATLTDYASLANAVAAL